VDLLGRPGTERLNRLGGVIPARVEAPVHHLPDATFRLLERYD
jgi:hypothetical protein